MMAAINQGTEAGLTKPGSPEPVLLGVVCFSLDSLQLCVLLPIQALQLPALLAGAARTCLL